MWLFVLNVYENASWPCLLVFFVFIQAHKLSQNSSPLPSPKQKGMRAALHGKVPTNKYVCFCLLPCQLHLQHVSIEVYLKGKFSYMLYWQISTLKQQELPEIWVAAGEDYLKQYTFVLSALPSKGELFDDKDRLDIQVNIHNTLLYVHIDAPVFVATRQKLQTIHILMISIFCLSGS